MKFQRGWPVLVLLSCAAAAQAEPPTLDQLEQAALVLQSADLEQQAAAAGSWADGTAKPSGAAAVSGSAQAGSRLLGRYERNASRPALAAKDFGDPHQGLPLPIPTWMRVTGMALMGALIGFFTGGLLGGAIGALAGAVVGLMTTSRNCEVSVC